MYDYKHTLFLQMTCAIRIRVERTQDVNQVTTGTTTIGQSALVSLDTQEIP